MLITSNNRMNNLVQVIGKTFRILTVLCWITLVAIPLKGAARSTGGSATNTATRQSDDRYPLIPYPQSLIPATGSFQLNARTILIVSDEDHLSGEISLLRALLRLPLKTPTRPPASNYITLRLNEGLRHKGEYTLKITAESIDITAKDRAGIFSAVETIRQLLPVQIETSVSADGMRLPAVSIQDYPKYEYRGMHLDVARHFFSMAYLYKFVDRLALYKFNKLHLHLTDDEGWRIEIKRYPKLTSQGAWRAMNKHDSACIQKAEATGDPDMYLDSSHLKMVDGKLLYGGFYTQEEMKDLVAYAKARHIDIIPEIDMPGHSRTAIALYPFLACKGAHDDGVGFSVPMCPCNEATYTFAQNVYKEIFDIFPYEYVHLGADEVNKESWQRSAACQVTLKEHNLKDVNSLQSYFVRRMEKFFNQHGRKLIGWDEILEGGVTPTANIMYWRSWVPKAPIIAARQGNKVIMTPGNPLYFDYIPDKNSLMNVYHFNPVPEGLNAKEAANILGAQANCWSEYIPTENRMEYQQFPRMVALAEVLWTAKTDDSSFLRRLDHQYDRMDQMQIHYRLPDINGLIEHQVFVDSMVLNIRPPKKGMVIRYTTDGSQPGTNAPLLDQPLVIKKDLTFKLAAFTSTGRRGDIYTCHFKKTNLSKAAMIKRNFTGLNVRYFPGSFTTVEQLDSATSAASWNQPGLQIDAKKATASAFGLIFEGVLTVPQTGIYTFYLTADDGATLKIDRQMVVDNDGLHAPLERNGQIALEAGHHFFRLNFIEGGGGYTLKLDYQGPKDNKPLPLTAEMLR